MVVAGPALGALAAFAAMCFLVFLYYAYGYSLGAVLVALANFFRSIGISLGWFGRISLGFIADGITAIDNAIRHAIGSGIIATRSAGLYMWHYLAYAIHEVGDTIAELAEATERRLIHTLHVTVPAFITNRLAWLVAHVAALEKAVAHLPSRVERITVERVHTVSRVIVHEAAAVGAAIPLPRITTLEREATALEKWVKAHASLLTISGALGLVGAAIFRHFDLGWLRCRGVNRVGRALCGLSGFIEELFALGVDAMVATNLCQVVTLTEAAAQEFVPALDWLVGQTDALIACQNAERPQDLAVAWYAPPPAENLVAI